MSQTKKKQQNREKEYFYRNEETGTENEDKFLSDNSCQIEH